VSPILAAVLKRDRAIVAFGLAGVATLSWTYLIYMDWGMRHMDVGMYMIITPAMRHWTAWELVLVFLMWTVMMVAMMVPAASPVILLLAEINRRRNEHQGTFVSTQFLSGSLPVSNGISDDRMAGRLVGRIPDGTKARRLLLGIDGSPCLPLA
jgi:predicted metal-binding membrane protein